MGVLATTMRALQTRTVASVSQCIQTMKMATKRCLHVDAMCEKFSGFSVAGPRQQNEHNQP